MNVIHILEPLASNAMAEKINELEHTIGTVLPSHFKDLLMQNNVCKPHKNHYKDKETEFMTMPKFTSHVFVYCY